MPRRCIQDHVGVRLERKRIGTDEPSGDYAGDNRDEVVHVDAARMLDLIRGKFESIRAVNFQIAIFLCLVSSLLRSGTSTPDTAKLKTGRIRYDSSCSVVAGVHSGLVRRRVCAYELSGD